MKKYIVYVILCFALCTPGFVSAAATNASRVPEVVTFDTTGKKLSSFLAAASTYTGGLEVAVGDLRGDGEHEIVLGSGPGSAPVVRIFNTSGKKIREFYAYGKQSNSGVQVAVGDLDNDGKSEIVTGTQVGAVGHVKVFDEFGNPKFLSSGYFPFGTSVKGGVNVAVGDVTGDGLGEIIVGSGMGMAPAVKILDRFGKEIIPSITPFPNDVRGGVAVAVGRFSVGAPLGVVTSVQRFGVSHIKAYMIDANKTLLSDFQPYPDAMMNGVSITTADINGDGIDEIITVPTAGTSHIRMFTYDGVRLANTFFAFEQTFTQGARIASVPQNGSADRLVVVPGHKDVVGRLGVGKYIDVDISEQVLKYYENGVLLGTFRVSTGKWSMPTPYGEFSILNKTPRAYSRKYGLYMPYWMEFFAGNGSGSYGLHELPEWPGGKKEGANHIGIRVSHGCVRLGVGNAKTLYDWAEIGTKVVIHE